MILGNDFYASDFEDVCSCDTIDWNRLRQKTVLVTGATGLIGSTLVMFLNYCNDKYDLGCRIIALVRDLGKARRLLGDSVTLIEGAVEMSLSLPEDVDYVIHGACPTASAYMVSNPLEVIKASVMGTMNLLELAREKRASFLFLSSMEAYGEVKSEQLLSEDDLGYVNPLNIRSCYPESKRMCEAIVLAYTKEYGMDAKSIRLVQTFGPGISYGDKRVFAMMARSAIEGKNIVLKTKGESKHPYLYVTDAVAAILTVLLKGQAGRSYNAANPATYCSIYEMGEMVAREFGDGRCAVRIEEENTGIYPNTTYLNLDITDIAALGWKPMVDLREMYSRLIRYMRKCE